jgi:predicted DNA-binding transcriptional regulator YafY
MARGDTLTRQFRLWLLLLDERQLAVEDAAARLGCTRRTIYRDLEVLQRAGMPLYQQNLGRTVRWRLDEGFHRTLQVQLSVQEAMALVAGAQSLASLSGTFFAQGATSAIDKVRHALTPAIRTRVEGFVKHLSASSAPSRELSAHRSQLDTIVAAVQGQQVLRLTYRKLNAPMAQEYTAEPHHLHMQGSSVYLVAWVRERKAPRIFLLDRLDAVSATGEQFERRPDLGPGVFSQGAFGLWDGPDVDLRLTFLGDAATIVSEQQFHPTQKLTRNSDDSVTLDLRLPISPSLKAWIRGFGKRVRVERPKSLLRDL